MVPLRAEYKDENGITVEIRCPTEQPDREILTPAAQKFLKAVERAKMEKCQNN